MSNSLDILSDQFAKRFEPNANGYLFRSTLKSPAILVTEAERDEFVRQYRRRARIALWANGTFAVLVSAFGLYGEVAWLHYNIDTIELWPVWVAIFLTAIIGTSFQLYIRAAPTRALRRRDAAFPPYPDEVAAQIEFSRIPWSLLLVGLMSVIPLAVFVGKAPLDLPSRAILGVFAVLMLGLLFVQILRKARFEIQAKKRRKERSKSSAPGPWG